MGCGGQEGEGHPEVVVAPGHIAEALKADHHGAAWRGPGKGGGEGDGGGVGMLPTAPRPLILPVAGTLTLGGGDVRIT